MCECYKEDEFKNTHTHTTRTQAIVCLSRKPIYFAIVAVVDNIHVFSLVYVFQIKNHIRPRSQSIRSPFFSLYLMHFSMAIRFWCLRIVNACKLLNVYRSLCINIVFKLFTFIQSVCVFAMLSQQKEKPKSAMEKNTRTQHTKEFSSHLQRTHGQWLSTGKRSEKKKESPQHWTNHPF